MTVVTSSKPYQGKRRKSGRLSTKEFPRSVPAAVSKKHKSRRLSLPRATECVPQIDDDGIHVIEMDQESNISHCIDASVPGIRRKIGRYSFSGVVGAAKSVTVVASEMDKENNANIQAGSKTPYISETVDEKANVVTLSTEVANGKEKSRYKSRRVSFSHKVRRALIMPPAPAAEHFTELPPSDLPSENDPPKPKMIVPFSSPDDHKKEPRPFERKHAVPRNVQKVYTIVGKMTGRIGGNGSGGAIYGELSVGSMQKVIELLKKHTNLNENSRFIDVGCGLGKPNLHVAQDPGVEFSYGIEMESVRWMLGLLNLNQVLKEAKSAKGAVKIGHRCMLACGNINQARTLDPFTHVYMFDIGFPPQQHEKLAKMFNRSASPYLISYYGPRYIVDKYGYNVELIIKAPTSMHGSSEGHTCYIYARCPQPDIQHNSSSITPCDPLFRKPWEAVQSGIESLSLQVQKELDEALGKDRPRARRQRRQPTRYQ